MGWSDNMEEDAELEEGEAAYYKDDDDRSIDPDIALSYLVRVLYCSCCIKVQIFGFIAN